MRAEGAKRKSKVLRQAIASVAIPALIAVLVVALMQRPARRDEVRISISELRSQAAELELLIALAQVHRLPGRFVRGHATQLARSIHASHSELEDLRTLPELETARKEADRDASELEEAVGRLQRTGRPPSRARAANVSHIGIALQTLDDSLR